MKILLLIPPTDLFRFYGGLRSFSNPQPSLGIAYIAAVLRENGYEVRVVDAYVNGYNLPQLMDIIGQFQPDLIGMSVLTPSSEVVYEISKNIRATFPAMIIVMGNLHATLFCEDILAKNYADFIVHGEGELTTLDLVKTLERQGNLENVHGISFKKNAMIINNPLRPHIEDLDSLPFPAWDLFPMEKYSTDPRTEVKKNAVETLILATRGCPNQCTFCSSRTERSLGSKYRMRSPKSVVDEMVYMNRRYGGEVFSFMDLAFPLVKNHAVDFCKEIIMRGLEKKFKWVTECRVKPLDEETLLFMKQAGCMRVCFGIESGNNETLKMLRKNFTIDDVRRAVKLAKKSKLEVDGMFMIGLPGESEALVNETINFALELDLRYAIFNIFVPYPGCDLYNTLKAEGKIRFGKWSDFTSYPTYAGGKPVYVPDHLTHDQLMNLQKQAMRKFYLRPRFIYEEFKRIKISKIKEYYQGLRAILS